jgi:hypothetical protein
MVRMSRTSIGSFQITFLTGDKITGEETEERYRDSTHDRMGEISEIQEGVDDKA